MCLRRWTNRADGGGEGSDCGSEPAIISSDLAQHTGSPRGVAETFAYWGKTVTWLRPHAKRVTMVRGSGHIRDAPTCSTRRIAWPFLHEVE